MQTLLKYLFSFFLRFAFWFRYRVTYKGLENLTPETLNKPGGILFLPNHPTVFIDPALVSLAVWRKHHIRPMVIDYMYYKPLVHSAMKLLNALPIPNFSEGSNSLKRKKGEHVMQTIMRDLRKGDNFLIYPSGRLKHTAIEEIGANSGVHRIVQEVPEANIVLVRIKGLWGSSFSRALTGMTPPMLGTVLNGIKHIFKNLIFFTPRRNVTIEFVPAPADFPYKAERLDFNKYLEDWYNQPDGLSDQRKGDSLVLVSYSRWKKQLPEIRPPESTLEEKIILQKIPEETKRAVTEQLGKMTNQNPETIKPAMHLTTDLGLDSLDTAELVAFLHEQFEVSNVPTYELTTVAKTMAIAHKQIKYEDVKDQEEVDTGKWFQPIPHIRCFLPEGQTLHEVFLNNCERMGKRIACADSRTGVLAYPQVKMRVILLAEYIRKLPGKYVGILLPASTTAYICVLASLLAGKVPLMINWTVGKKHLESVVHLSKVEAVLSSWTFVDRLENVDFNGIDDRMIMLEDLKHEIGLFDKFKAYFMAKGRTKQILKHFNVSHLTKNDSAVLLFTSGTESMPKGVPLSHENILSNQRDGFDAVEIYTDDTMLSFLPPFHAFGFSYGGLIGLLSGIRTVAYPDPTNGKGLAEAFEKWRTTLFFSAPTFAKNMLKAAKPKQLKTLHTCITGAERTPPELVALFEAMGKRECLSEGYGITECGPVLTLNMPNEPIIGVGKPMGSVTIRIVHQETYEPLPQGEQGMIIAKGPNIFSGYINENIKSPFLQIDGEQWYITGDLGYLHESGNLIISGRKKRFIKIGGEMVSLAAIEEALLHAAHENDWHLDPEGPSLAICAKENDHGKPDIFLFCKFPTTIEIANQALKKGGLSNLVKITSVVELDDIPIMGSGKINYRKLEDEYFNTLSQSSNSSSYVSKS